MRIRKIPRHFLPWFIFAALLIIYLLFFMPREAVPEFVPHTIDMVVMDEGTTITVKGADDYGNEVVCSLNNSEELYRPGDILRIVYGGIAESYPGQFVDLQSVEIIGRQNALP
ncbi:MAG: hypothetical protein ACOX81_06570 [Candidatus Heteroscillospira sp.]|jgi:hypothetical protein